jgi:hypothetical protein
MIIIQSSQVKSRQGKARQGKASQVKACPSLTHQHSHFAQSPSDGKGSTGAFEGRVCALDYFHEAHYVCGSEEMHAQEEPSPAAYRQRMTS